MAKSMFRFSWAMSVLGIEQLRKLVSDEHADRRKEEIRSAFDAVSDSAGQQFSGRSRSLYETMDRLQQESLDMLFDLPRPSSWKADKLVNKVADLADRSAVALRDFVHDKPKAAAPADTGSEASEPKHGENRGA